MVFGNKGDGSGTGVCFTRDPSTGEQALYGEFLANAQGEDVVAGHPHARADRARWTSCCRRRTRSCSTTIAPARGALPRHAGHRVHGRGGHALPAADAHRQAHRGARRCGSRSRWSTEGLISREEAVARIDPAQLDQLLHPMIDPSAEVEVAAKGLNASPGRGLGRDRLRRRHGRGARQGRRERDPRPLGDDAGRHPRDDRRRAGHPDRPRRA